MLKYEKQKSSLVNSDILKRGGTILVIKCTILFLFSILAIIRADFRYIDDQGRILAGTVSDFNVYNRYFAKILCELFSSGKVIYDVSPLSQIATLFMMAIAVTIVIWAIAPEKMLSNWIVVSALPFAVSPYFMENISYKIECVMHGCSVMICILPVLLYKKRDWLYMLVVAVCTILMCITYQGASGIFPVTIVMIIAVEWNNGEKLQTIWKLIYTSVLGYGIGLIFFKYLIMKPVHTWVSSEIFPFNKLLLGTIHNLITFYTVMFDDFKISWLCIISIIIIIYILIYGLTSKRTKLLSFFVALVSVIVMFSLCFGIFPVLVKCVYMPRVMYPIGIVISMMCIFIIKKGSCTGEMACLAIAWCFITFAFNYGNCLALQKEYTDMRIQTVVDYLNQNYDESMSYVLEIDGSIGRAPAIRNKVNTCRILDRLIPNTLGGGWSWSEYRLYKYCGLPSNYTVVWASDRGNDSVDLLNKNLPLIKTCMWFDIFGDEGKLLIRLKE